jgi:centrosomal protein CEP41
MMPLNESVVPKIILLDLREREEYQKWHIRNALSFPALSIQQDHVFGQLNLYKNKDDKLLVVYSSDERQGTQQAKIIFEKGFDNVYLLTGGCSVFAFENHDLIDGPEVPSLRQLK